jgi:hypothetical protein
VILRAEGRALYDGLPEEIISIIDVYDRGNNMR